MDPRLSLLPLNGLRAFEAAARHLSFSHAADELGVTPAAVSHQIRGLEERLGHRLFLRRTRAVALTDAGLRLLPGVAQGFTTLVRAVAELEESGEETVLTVTASPSVAARWLLPRLDGFQGANPGIDIRATRKIEADNVTAGLLVRGTAQVPVLTVFSEPSMEQSEALSYLVTGKPLSSLKSGEGDMLGTAARALGTAGGDLLAKSIGGRLGVDDIGVADNGALGGAAFTVGKYLSPKLYLSYGVGIFEPGEVVTLRYLFSRHWNFEAQNATTGSRAGINYRIER